MLSFQNDEKEPVTEKPAVVELPPVLNTPAFRKAWCEWIADRKKRRIKKYTEEGARMQLNRLAKLGEAEAIRAIEHSLANQYQGIHSPKGGDAPPAGGFKTAREKEADHVGQMFNDAFEGDL